MIDERTGLTEDELRVYDLLVDAVEGYSALDVQHNSEPGDFVAAIHRCQDLLAVRVARRLFPEGWPESK